MKMEIEVDLEKFRLGLVGDGYLYDEAMAMPEEQLKIILQDRITHRIQIEFMRSRSIVQDILAAREPEDEEDEQLTMKEFNKEYDEALTQFAPGDRVQVGTIRKYEKNQWLQGYHCTVKSVTDKYVRVIPDGYPDEAYSVSPLILTKITE